MALGGIVGNLRIALVPSHVLPHLGAADEFDGRTTTTAFANVLCREKATATARVLF
jgi:hypothetical protein